MADEKRRAGDMIVDPAELPVESGTPYPAPHDQIVKGRHRSRLSPPLGLTKFGVNVLRIEPGAQSSARHWHSKQDEFVYVLEGEATLVTDEGDTVLTAGMAAGFPAGNPNGHAIVNRSNADLLVLEVGDRMSPIPTSTWLMRYGAESRTSYVRMDRPSTRTERL
jgi:uncharacterized cupin superfamily protein